MKTIAVMGPGNVTGIQTNQILRMDPPDGASDFEPSNMCSIEFDDPALPWMFSPGGAKAGRLLPWMTLVVVEQGPSAVFQPGDTQSKASLEVSGDAVAELPDLTESWAWAHAQADGPLSVAADILKSKPTQNLSRLLSPRRLMPHKKYHAIVTPVFRVGIEAYFNPEGDAADTEDASLAWSQNDSSILLPAYIHWEFKTGEAGSFETLVSKLQARPPLPQLGQRAMDVRDPGGGLQPVTTAADRKGGAILDLEGALKPSGKTRQVWPKAVRLSFRRQFKKIAENPSEGKIGPPVYGARPSRVLKVDQAAPKWMHQLNLDPRDRAAAGLGAKIVQKNQESIMAEAWRQIGEVEKANQLIRQTHFAAAVSGRIFERTLNARSNAAVLQFAGAVAGRVEVESGKTLAAEIRYSATPDAVLSLHFKKLTRGRGPLSRTGARMDSSYLYQAANRFQKSVSGEMVQSDGISLQAAAQAYGTGSRASGRQRNKTGGIEQAISPASYRAMQSADATVAAESQQKTLRIGNAVRKLKTTLNPRRTLGAAIEQKVRLAGPVTKQNLFVPVLASPEFSQPVAALVADQFPDIILPGLEHVQQHSLCALETNNRFIAALFVGLNHELMRELRWRGYPTDERGTGFHHFWPRPETHAKPDIAPIHEWKPTQRLGAQLGRSNSIILIMRSPLLWRFPSTVITAVPAIPAKGKPQDRWPSSNPEDEIVPLFSGRLPPDILYFAFDLTADDAASGGPDSLGWYFSIQEHLSAPRFGLDEVASQTIKSHRDLAWSDLMSPGGFNLPAFVDAAEAPAAFAKLETAGAAGNWGQTSAHLAAMLRKPPLRVEIHADDLLP
ncbi:hypothetical protein [Hyphobacterium sp.]|uniref:hypothetical protein n=1 Tax=Hyphobacterium sp. TaxID=2004662 RepID=UPI003BAC1E0B